MGGNEEGVICFLGVGSNLGDSRKNCGAALAKLGDVPEVSLVRRSSLYRTEPAGHTEQPWFVNAVAEIRTILGPRILLERLQEIEGSMGRFTKGDGGPRPIDLDILLYGQGIIDEEDLVIPHKEMHRRRFVLVPLHEIAPWVIHPRFGISVRGLLDRLEDRGIVERIESPS